MSNASHKPGFDAPERPCLALLMYPGFSEFEVMVALNLLARCYQVVCVGLTLEPLTGEGGLRVLPERTIQEVRPESFAVVLIPGAVDLEVLADVPALDTFLRDMHAQGKLLGAICGGGFALAKAGLLEGLPYTVTFTAEQRAFLGVFPEAGFEYRDVVRSGHIITAQGHAFVEFGLEVAGALGAVQNLEATRTFYRGLGNPSMEQEHTGQHFPFVTDAPGDGFSRF